MRLVVALGGNALLRRGEPLDVERQRARLAEAAAALAPLAREHQLVVTHGNGPQVGLLALRSEGYRGARPDPLDVLDAESQGMLGYLLELELRRALPDREVAALLTLVEVDAGDPLLSRRDKPIGPSYPEAVARELAAARGWVVARDGAGFRRVVPSPAPRRVLELEVIRRLVDAGVVVVCAGGGGVPVVRDPSGALGGVEAVVDKDRTAALLADALDAGALLLVTDVAGVYEGWGGPAPRLIRAATPDALRALSLAAGSMGPKVDAACRFVDGGAARRACIGALEDVVALARGDAGTVVSRSRARPRSPAPR